MKRSVLRFVGFSVFVAMALPNAACVIFGSGSGNDDDGSAVDETGDGGSAEGGSGPLEPMVETCRGDATDEEVADTVAITVEFEQSLHEMVACGGLAVTLVSAIVDGIFDAIAAQSSDATPDAWVYQGEGVYFTDSAMAGMEMRFYLSEDLEYGPAGTLVTENLFLVDTYLVNAYLDIDFQTGAAAIVYDEPGPLVELLGFGSNPPNPLPVDWTDLTSLKQKLRALELEGNVAVADVRDHSTIMYYVDIPRTSASALLDFGMDYELDTAGGVRADLEQQLIVDDWGIQFVNGNPGALDGTIDFRVNGNFFPYQGTIAYDNSTYGVINLSCQ